MRLQDFRIDAKRLWVGEEPLGVPLAVIDLDATGEAASTLDFPLELPPCPVIGVGSRGHPLAPLLDAVIEPPVSLDVLAAQVLARPRAASVVVELLRLLPVLTLRHGLVAESLAYAVLQGSAEHAAWLAKHQSSLLAQPSPSAPSSSLAQPSPPTAPAGLSVARQGDTVVLTLDRPPGNAIDRVLRDAIAEAFAAVALDGSIARVRLMAAGRVFSLGAERAEFGTTRDPATAHLLRRATLPARSIAACADRLEVHVSGACVGAGLEMAAFARKLTASPHAWFQLPELAMGVLPGAGGCVSLVRRIGRARTALMILSGRRISARTALAWGLVDEIVTTSADSAGDDLAADQRGDHIL